MREKLVAAESAALADGQFRPNVKALPAVQPTDLNATEIDVRLGSTWISLEDIEHFAQELLSEPGVSVSHAPQLGLWVVKGRWSAKNSVANGEPTAAARSTSSKTRSTSARRPSMITTTALNEMSSTARCSRQAGED